MPSRSTSRIASPAAKRSSILNSSASRRSKSLPDAAPPRVTSQQIIRILERLGFARSRSSGSHFIYIDDTGRRVTVPSHAGRILHPKVLKNILDDSGLTIED